MLLLQLALAFCLLQSPAPASLEELPGPLVIAGGGNFPDAARQRFFELAGKEKAHIVVIPTASEGADEVAKKSGYLKEWEALKPASVVLLHTRDRKKADTEEFVKPLQTASAVWFSGGDQTKIADAYLKTKVEEELKKLHQRGGVMGGTSAGAAILSTPMIAGGSNEPKLAVGLSLLPGFIVDQHFVARNRSGRLTIAVEKNPGCIGLGIDEDTVVVAKGRRLEVIGKSTATILLPAGVGRAAETITLKEKGTADILQLRRAVQNRVAKEPFPPKQPPGPIVKKGTLVIVGGGGVTPDIMNRFFDAAGGKDALVVVIPTAAESYNGIGESGDERFLKQNGAKNLVRLHTRDRKEANDPVFSEVLTRATAVWFGGGRQWKFVDAYEGTLTEKRFHEVLQRGGVIGGTSAGASIQSEYMPRGHPLGNTVMAAEGYEKGFGFLPGCAVDQHFFARKRFPDMAGLMKRYPQYLGIGIDETTALVVQGQVGEVVGKGKVAFYDTNRKPAGGVDYEPVSPGQKYDLVKRQLVSTEK